MHGAVVARRGSGPWESVSVWGETYGLCYDYGMLLVCPGVLPPWHTRSANADVGAFAALRLPGDGMDFA